MLPRPQLHGTAGRLPALLLPALLLLGSCTDGRSPVDAPSGGVQAQLALAPRILPSLATEGSAEIVHVRVVATVFGGSEVVGSTEMDVDPNASSWPVDLEVTLPAGTTQIEITVELMNASGGVEWSGHVGPLTVTPGSQSTVPTVNIVRGPLDNLAVASVTVSGAPALLRVGESAQLSATAQDQGGAVLSGAQIYWTSQDETVATVTSTGMVEAVGSGTARILATAGSVQVTTEIEVRAVVAGVTVTPPQATAESLEQDLPFTAYVVDANQTPIPGETVTWSSADPAIVAHQGNGVFRTKGEGTTTITATSTSNGSLTGSATVTVEQVAASVEVEPAGYTFTYLDQEKQYTATAYDGNHQVMSDALFLWSTSNGDVASVDGNGLVTAEGNGTADIIAEAATASASAGGAQGGPVGTGVEGSTSVTVQQEIDHVVVSPSEATINGIGTEQQFYAAAKDAGGSEIVGTPIGWSSSNQGVATIDGDGLATSTGAGTTTITAEAMENGSGTGLTGTSTLNVTETVLNVSVDPTEATLHQVDETVQLTATTVDDNGDPVQGVSYSWSSSDEEVATVDQGGLVTAVADGEAIITVTGSLASAVAGPDGPSMSEGPTATATITVDLQTPASFFPLAVGNSWTYEVTWDNGTTGGEGPQRTTTQETDQITATATLLGYLWFQACGGGVLGNLLADENSCALYRASALGMWVMGLGGAWGPYPLIQAPAVEGTTWGYTTPDGWSDAYRIVALLSTLTVQGTLWHNVLHVQATRSYMGSPDSQLNLYFALGVGIIYAQWAWSEGGGTWYPFYTAALLSYYLAGSNSPTSASLEAATGGATGFQPPTTPQPYHFFGVRPQSLIRRNR